MKDLIQKLSDMRGASGFEDRITPQITELFAPYADEVYTDALGSVIAVKRCGKKNAKRLMIEGHCDEIGLMVSGIDEKGFLSFVNVGGVDPRVLPMAEVIVHGRRDIPAVIGIPDPRTKAADAKKKSFQREEMAIDTGLLPEHVRELISVGDSVTLSQSCGQLLDGQYSGKTMDDRAGVAAVLAALKSLQRVQLNVDLYAVAAVQEEVGCRGAKAAVYDIMPDLAVAVDVCHGITPDNSQNAFENGSGTVISLGPNIHPKLVERLIQTADSRRIPYEIDVDGGDTGTDAWEMQISRAGVPTALLSIPLKYMHTSVETLAVSDVQATADLLSCFVAELNENPEEWLCF